MTSPVAPPPPEPAPGPTYDQLLAVGRPEPWRPVVGILIVGLGTFVVSPIVWIGPFLAYAAFTADDLGAAMERFVDFSDPAPSTLAYLLLSIATAIPLCWLVVRALHGVRFGWLSSVALRLRWGFLLACMGLSIVALFATVAVAAVLPAQETGAELTGELADFDRRLRDLLLLVVLLTPLQAAAEEYAFRGYLLQAFGGLFRSRTAAIVLSSVLFALAHGIGQSVPVFFDRLAFGLVAAVLTVVTGGLEAGIAMHVANNWLAFTAAVMFDQLGSALNPTGGTWWSIPVTLTQSLTYLALAWWVARQMGLAERADRGVLEASRPRV